MTKKVDHNFDPADEPWRGLSESVVESELRKYTLKAGGKSYKFVSPGNAGVPDRIVILPEFGVLFVELKTDTGQLRKSQIIQCRRMHNKGACVLVARGILGVARVFMFAGYQAIAKEIAKKYNLDWKEVKRAFSDKSWGTIYLSTEANRIWSTEQAEQSRGGDAK